MIENAIVETITPIIKKIIDDRPVNLSILNLELIDEPELRNILNKFEYSNNQNRHCGNRGNRNRHCGNRNIVSNCI